MKTKKIKTFVLTVSRYFPATHPRKGEPTYFPEKIQIGIMGSEKFNELHDNDCAGFLPKLHTCRANYPLWKKRIEQVQAGEAILSIRYWSGKPYNSPQVEICQLDKDSGIGVQMLDMSIFQSHNMAFVNNYTLTYSNSIQLSVSDLCNNDGLSLQDFKNWFKGYDLSEPMVIIQFTKFRY
jgi:hypothetical protein